MIKLISFIFTVFFIQTGFNLIPVNKIHWTSMSDNDASEIIIDSDFSDETAISGTNAPEEIRKNLRLITVQYYSFDNKLHKGQIVIHKSLTDDVKSLFNIIKEQKFPVARVIPIVKYRWDDQKSMSDNNTSAFNYRFITGTNKLSYHSFGMAIDINPLLNPYIKDDRVLPEEAEYDPAIKGTITKNSFLVKEFKKLGWAWGGDWKDRKDYQHFEKKLE